MKRVVVGIDGSAGSADALLWSATLAKTCHAALVAVTAFRPGQAEVAPPDFVRLREERARLLEDEWALPGCEIVPVRTVVVDGDPREVLVALADSEDADLLVVGAGGSGNGPGFLHFGSVAEYLVHHSNRPLAVIPSGARGPVTRIVLGVDGSAHNAVTVRWTADLAASLGVPVVATAVEEPLFEWTPSTSPGNWRRAAEDEIRNVWAAPISGAGVELDVVAVRDLHPVAGLLRVASDTRANLVVVGTRGLGGMVGLQAGGVAVKIVHHAEIPVVLVPFDLPRSR